jgi:hypothetical protein
MENEEAITKIREIFASGGNVMSKVAEDMLNISFQKGTAPSNTKIDDITILQSHNYLCFYVLHRFKRQHQRRSSTVAWCEDCGT